MKNLSYGSEFDLQDSERARTIHFERWCAKTRFETKLRETRHVLFSLYRCGLSVVSLHIMHFSLTDLHAFVLFYEFHGHTNKVSCCYHSRLLN